MPNAEWLSGVRLMLAVLLAVTTVHARRTTQPDLRQDRAAFPIQADGAHARVSQRWTLRRADNSGLGLITSLVRCADTFYLTDNEYRIYRFDSRHQTAVHEFVSDPSTLGLPRALAADCERHKLYVITAGSKMAAIVDMNSGTIETRHRLPHNLSLPQRAYLVGSDTLYVSGVFNQTAIASPLRTLQADSFFESLHLGLRISLTTGAIDPLFQPYETRCTAAGECFGSSFDRLSASGAQWVVAQSISSRIALYGAAGQLRSTHSTASPRFVRDGTELPLRSTTAAQVEWTNHNSTIRSVFGVGGLIVAVHATFEGGFDRPENAPIARPFMNIHDPDGLPLTSDISLSNLPVGRDDANLYVVGRAEDRRGPGKVEQSLMQIPVKRGRQSISK